MKKIKRFLDYWSSEYDKLPKGYKITSMILTIMMVLDFTGVIPGPIPWSESTKDKPAIATIELENGSCVIMSGYALLDYYDEFESGDAVYIELDKNCLPSSVRHWYDAHGEDGQMYAETTIFGSYEANLIPGKVISMK